MEDYVAIKPVEEETNGIIIPDTADKDRPYQGEVIAAGEGVKLKKGDKVIYSKYATDPIEVDNQEIVLISKEFIFAKIN